MSLFIMLAISLGICLVPVCLVSRAKTASARDYFVASQPTPADAMRNCSVVYFLRIATLAPFFAWGASGDFWTAVLIAHRGGLGVYVVSMRRHRLPHFPRM